MAARRVEVLLFVAARGVEGVLLRIKGFLGPFVAVMRAEEVLAAVV
jgi:hypothetical protein